MSSDRNRHGLPRHIPEDTKRKVRIACGNGCVVCGWMPFQYDHFDPEYAKATVHNPERIALLCTKHHAEKTSGRLGTAEIAAARLNPHNARHDARWDVPLGKIGARSVTICGNTIVGGLYPGLVVNKVPVFGVRRDDSGDWLLSGAFCDEAGQKFVRIVDNELTLYRGQWDVSLEGKDFIESDASVPEILEPHGIDFCAPGAGTWDDWVARPDLGPTFNRQLEARRREQKGIGRSKAVSAEVEGKRLARSAGNGAV